MEKLRECPFCGSRAKIETHPIYTHLERYDPETCKKRYWVQCKICATHCDCLEYDTKEEAVAAWNRRAGEDTTNETNR